MPARDGVRPVSQRSIVELVIEEVRRSILDGSLPPGAPVSIAELALRLDVSHIPVREGLRRLEGEGLVELRRGRSAVVAPLSAGDLASVLRLRSLLEADTFARAIPRYRDADLDALGAAHAALAVRAGDDAEGLTTRHTEFHRLLVRPGATAWDLRLLDLLWQAHARYLQAALARSLAGPPNALRDRHAALLAAARGRSVRGARRAIAQHLEAAAQNSAVAGSPT